MYFTQMLFLHGKAHDKEGTPHPKETFKLVYLYCDKFNFPQLLNIVS